MMKALVAEVIGPVYSVHVDIQFVLRNLQICKFPDCAQHSRIVRNIYKYIYFPTHSVLYIIYTWHFLIVSNLLDLLLGLHVHVF